MTKNWSDLWHFFSKVIFLNFSLRKYIFFLFFIAEFELLTFHKNNGNFSENEQAEVVENLPTLQINA